MEERRDNYYRGQIRRAYIDASSMKQESRGVSHVRFKILGRREAYEY